MLSAAPQLQRSRRARVLPTNARLDARCLIGSALGVFAALVLQAHCCQWNGAASAYAPLQAQRSAAEAAKSSEASGELPPCHARAKKARATNAASAHAEHQPSAEPQTSQPERDCCPACDPAQKPAIHAWETPKSLASEVRETSSVALAFASNPPQLAGHRSANPHPPPSDRSVSSAAVPLYLLHQSFLN